MNLSRQRPTGPRYGALTAGFFPDEDVDAAEPTVSPLIAEDPAETRRRHIGMLREASEAAERQYVTLAQEVHTPALDDALYRKYLFPSSMCDPSLEDSPEAAQRRLMKLLRLLETLATHKNNTLDVLEAIAKREQVFNELLALSNNEVLEALELQAVALQALHQLQVTTLEVVEGIVKWRHKLSLPYAFMTGDENYLLRIAESMKMLEHTEIGRILPLRYSRFPLGSNVPSMKLFAANPSHLTYPLRSQKSSLPHQDGPVFRKRLATAEAVIHGEVETQLNVMEFLLERCRQGFFLPVVDLAAAGVYEARGRKKGAIAADRSASHSPRREDRHHHAYTSHPTRPFDPTLLPGIRIISPRYEAELFDALEASLAKLYAGPHKLKFKRKASQSTSSPTPEKQQDATNSRGSSPSPATPTSGRSQTR